MKNQALFSMKDKSKILKCRLLQFLFGTLKTGLLCQGVWFPAYSNATCTGKGVKI